jgi:serine/threonine-protein kinase RsbW
VTAHSRDFANTGALMTQVEPASHAGPAYSSVIELHVPTELGQLTVVRTVAQSIASSEDFDLDAVADIKLAVDEACATLISRATLGARLNCRYNVLPGALEVVISTSTCTPDVPNKNSFGWHVLCTLTDTLTVEQLPEDSADSSSYATVIRFTKKKRTDDG